ncbi:hypothetical protein DAEQUDRAFT_763362 [Daedalea quercina L-15889]|uniref:Uncharacterized protein n=1 Tax=Daedalea quercina L-15889 TaxID=1314783 RepID=A0A165SEC5_9APHY|nr:hypothetical protein DAEQUDRAFT_763362 [Daedalea quercina L-15889]
MARWLGSQQQSDSDPGPVTTRRSTSPPTPLLDDLSAERQREIADSLQTILTALKAMCRYAPRDADDVLTTERILAEDLGLPLPLVWQILEDAEYWVRSLGHCGSLMVAAFDAEIQESLCCTATIPSDVKEYKPLRRIVFTIESHDQGWRSSDDGGSWTWFEVGSVASRRLIVNNIPASRDYHTHHIQWDHSVHGEGTGDAQLDEWMSDFTGGHKLSVFAKAQFGGWANHVRRVRVEAYCACV